MIDKIELSTPNTAIEPSSAQEELDQKLALVEKILSNDFTSYPTIKEFIEKLDSLPCLLDEIITIASQNEELEAQVGEMGENGLKTISGLSALRFLFEWCIDVPKQRSEDCALHSFEEICLFLKAIETCYVFVQETTTELSGAKSRKQGAEFAVLCLIAALGALNLLGDDEQENQGIEKIIHLASQYPAIGQSLATLL